MDDISQTADLIELRETPAVPYYTRKELEYKFPNGSWQRNAFLELHERLQGTSRAFPCVFGVNGFRQDQLRYHFSEEPEAYPIARALTAYVSHCRAYGANTSFVVIIRTRAITDIEEYHKQFWALLRDIRRHDDHPWPEDMPIRVDDPGWEFCFAGEPLFVVCTTPAHIIRQSRRSLHLTMLFQPRWVFANLLDTQEKANKAFSSVRRILRDFDDTNISPHLGMYGSPGNLEHLQYFLGDGDAPLGCPYTRLTQG